MFTSAKKCIYSGVTITMEVLSKLFGSRVRVKVMRMFLLNPEKIYEPKDIVAASRAKERDVGKETAALAKAGMIHTKSFYKEIGKGRIRSVGWALDPSFIYLMQLRSLLADGLLLKSPDLVKRLQRGGSLKLIVLSGIFLGRWESRVDLLVVGDKLKRGLLERILRSIESEIGKELRYSILDNADFEYRLSIRDRLVRDIFDYPYQIILDKRSFKP